MRKSKLKKKIFALIISLFARPLFFKFWERVNYVSLRFIGVDNFDEWGYTTGENWVLNKIMKNHAVHNFFDVGANLGQSSKLIKGKNPNVHVYAFEAHPKTFERLRIVADEYEKFNAFNVAVGNPGNEQKTIALFDYAGKDGSQHASVYKEVFSEIHQSTSVVRHDIQLVSLKQFCNENNISRISFLKIDTEGSEIDVLKGLGDFINNSQVDFIQFEFNNMNLGKNRFYDFWNILNHNYAIYRLLPQGLGRIYEYRAWATEVYMYQNYLAIRKEIKF